MDMPTIEVVIDDKVLKSNDDGTYEIRLSEKEHNGITYTEDGKLTSMATDDLVNKNYPGNGIYGDEGVKLQLIRCDSSVSRIDLVKDSLVTQSHEGVYITSIINQIIDEALNGGPKPPEPTKSVDEVAHEVIEGLWGNGEERRNRLTEAGYNYEEVQKRVNEILAGG